ncbi:MAG: type II toxin-antitoxin system PemK/MazF family toxin [Acaryochloridaceae cyanobacterium RU_4_10]|nr:type II toxin-antitoxin system PemK/MazF family toxin [Acaryochloridaceae cyanobacterium RU_4_10]
MAILPEQVPPGREQKGYRPVVVVGIPEALGTPRYPMLLVIPLTTNRSQSWAIECPALYPVLSTGEGGLPTDSIALLDQVRSLDNTRVKRYIGTLPPQQYQPILNGLSQNDEFLKVGISLG